MMKMNVYGFVKNINEVSCCPDVCSNVCIPNQCVGDCSTYFCPCYGGAGGNFG